MSIKWLNLRSELESVSRALYGDVARLDAEVKTLRENQRITEENHNAEKLSLELGWVTKERDELRDRLKASEEKRDDELGRHLRREDALVQIIARKSGHATPIEQTIPKPIIPVDPKAMSAQDEAKLKWFVDDAIAVGRTAEDGREAFEEWKATGKMPYERLTEAEQ